MARDTAVDDELLDDEDTPSSAADDAFGDDFADVATAAIDDDAPDATDGTEEEVADLLDDDTDKVEGQDRGDGRDATGKFAGKMAVRTTTNDEPETSAADATGATAAVDSVAAEPEQPKWEPLTVRVDKDMLPIDEVTLTRANGFHLLAVKDADFEKFANRMSKGVVGEKLWRQLNDGVKELAAERAAPQPDSDATIEARVILAAIKDRLPEILEPYELQMLEKDIKLAKIEYKETHKKTVEDYFAKQAEAERNAPEVEERQAYEGLANEMLLVYENMKEQLGEMTEPQLRAAYDSLVGVRRGVYWKEADGWYVNSQEIFNRLQAAKASVIAPAASDPASRGTTGAPAPSTATAADRFNKAGNTAARPGTTSVKANRDTRPRPARHHRDAENANRRQPVKNAAMAAEDQWRASQRKLMASNTLDFEDDDDT